MMLVIIEKTHQIKYPELIRSQRLTNRSPSYLFSFSFLLGHNFRRGVIYFLSSRNKHLGLFRRHVLPGFFKLQDH